MPITKSRMPKKPVPKASAPCPVYDCVLEGYHPWHRTAEQVAGLKETRRRVEEIRETYVDDSGRFTAEGRDAIYMVWSGGRRPPTPWDQPAHVRNEGEHPE